MKFRLFSATEFDITDPVELIECYCFQTNFYSAYDLLLPNRRISDVAKIGARIDSKLIEDIGSVVKSNADLSIFKTDLTALLAEKSHAIKSLSDQASGVLEQLMSLGIGLSQATKVLHTAYPEVMPMIDSMLQEEYRRSVAPEWKQSDPRPILYAYYINLQEEPNRGNLTGIYHKIKQNLPCLTMVRVFDIIWWSYLRAKKLRRQNNVNWSTVTG